MRAFYTPELGLELPVICLKHRRSCHRAATAARFEILRHRFERYLCQFMRLFAASPSTKNEAGKRDPQMHSSKEGEDVGVDASSEPGHPYLVRQIDLIHDATQPN